MLNYGLFWIFDIFEICVVAASLKIIFSSLKWELYLGFTDILSDSYAYDSENLPRYHLVVSVRPVVAMPQ